MIRPMFDPTEHSLSVLRHHDARTTTAIFADRGDAYAGYDGLYRGGVTEVACWAHLRRKVLDLNERVATPLSTDIFKRIGAL